MISYLFIARTPEPILRNDHSYLPHLIWFGVPSVALKIQQFLNAVLREDVMAATNTFREAEREKQLADVIKLDIGVSTREQNLASQLVCARHSSSSATGSTPDS